MPSKNVSQIFKELSFDKKLLGIGSVLMIISVFLPWYQDLDSFKTGDMFLGISGPMYLAGGSLLFLSAIIMASMFLDYTGKRPSWMPKNRSGFYLSVGIFAFYMLILVNSVYFHAKFGVNITLKQSQFGMFLAFIAASLISIGGYLSMQDKDTLIREFQESFNEPVMTTTSQERKRDNIIKKSAPVQSTAHYDVPVDVESIEQMQMNNVSPTIEPTIERKVESNPQPYRMDL